MKPVVVTLGVAVHACAKAGNRESAEAIFNTALMRGSVCPNAVGLEHLINASGKTNGMLLAELR